MATALTLSVPCDHASDCFAVEVYEEAGAPRPGAKSPLYDLMVQVLDGVVYLVAGDDEVALTPGDSTNVRAGTPYRAWNAGDDDARWVEIYG